MDSTTVGVIGVVVPLIILFSRMPLGSVIALSRRHGTDTHAFKVRKFFNGLIGKEGKGGTFVSHP